MCVHQLLLRQATFCISHLHICTFTPPTNTENPDKNQFKILLSSLQVLSTQTPEKERGLPALQVVLKLQCLIFNLDPQATSHGNMTIPDSMMPPPKPSLPVNMGFGMIQVIF